MLTITYIEHDGRQHRVEAPADRSLMQIAVDHAIPGIVGECGGSCSCGTCHCYIDAPWSALLPAIAESEAFMLDGVFDRRPGSRLACQIRMSPALDGIVVSMPSEQV